MRGRCGAARLFVTGSAALCYVARALISWILIVLAMLSVLLNVWQWYAGRRFHFARDTRGSFTPPVSILRPLKGCDAETEQCLASWFVQEYGASYELLFGVALESDPVCEIVRRLISKHPERNAELVICKPILGANAKVSSLCYLAKKAKHEHLAISDQDVLVSRDFLSALVEPLGEKTVGLVNCFYILANPRGPAMWLEAVAVNADFWSQVLQGNTLKPMDFALGAAMATTKERLAQIGGFEGLLEYLADDYQLGNKIARTGARLTICPMPVECRTEAQSASAVWQHQLRWARTIRVCQPMPYFFSILSNGTFWPLVALAANRSSGWGLMIGAIVVRIATARATYERLTRKSGWKAGFLAPTKDLLQVLIWALAFAGNEITWRNQRFHVDKGGKLTPLVRK